MHSDLSEIYEYYSENGIRTDSELIDLFVEVENGKETPPRIPDSCKAEVLTEMRIVLKNLHEFLSTIFILNTVPNIYILPRDPDEYSDLRFINILDIAIDFTDISDAQWNDAINIIKNLDSYKERNNNRSVYLRELLKKYNLASQENQNNAELKEKYQYAESIMNICHNYALEISICNTSKHYNVCELSDGNDTQKSTFKTDFLQRLTQDWDITNDRDKRYLLPETNNFEKFTSIHEIPDFKKAVRITEYISYNQDRTRECIQRYEYDTDKQIKEQKKLIRKATSLRLCSLLLWGAVASAFNFSFEYIGSTIEALTINSMASVALSFIVSVIFIFVYTFIIEKITSCITQKHPDFLPLSDAIEKGLLLLKDCICFRMSSSTYYKQNAENREYKTEPINKEKPADFVISKELKKYQNLTMHKDDITTSLFAPSNIYPIAKVSDRNVIKELSRLEELHHYKFGVAYTSKYNTLIVDAINNKAGGYFPYERIIPTSRKSGVVVIPIYNGNLILLRQFRHAIREDQYSFPRGFAEPNCDSEENVIRELQEEIGATINDKPQFIGHVVPDSGLTGMKTDAYCVNIEKYEKNTTPTEGIKSIEELSFSKFEQWIKAGKINDGFSLSAYTLYKASILSKKE